MIYYCILMLIIIIYNYIILSWTAARSEKSVQYIRFSQSYLVGLIKCWHILCFSMPCRIQCLEYNYCKTAYINNSYTFTDTIIILWSTRIIIIYTSRLRLIIHFTLRFSTDSDRASILLCFESFDVKLQFVFFFSSFFI